MEIGVLGEAGGASPYGHQPLLRGTGRRSGCPAAGPGRERLRAEVEVEVGVGAGAGAAASPFPEPRLPKTETGPPAHARAAPARPGPTARSAERARGRSLGGAVTSPGRPRPDPMKENVRRGTLPARRSPCTDRRWGQSQPPRRLGPPPGCDVTAPPAAAEGRSQSAPPRAPAVPCFRPAPLSPLPRFRAPAVAAQPGPVRAGGGAARDSATWSALRRGPSSTSSSPPTPTRWARTVGRERGGHLCGHRTRRGAPSAGPRARPAPQPPVLCPLGWGWEIP